MKTITYSQLIKKIAGLRGQSSLSSADQVLARLAANARAKQGWEFFPWPDLCDVEERRRLDYYIPGTAYPIDTQKLFADDGLCYVATRAALATEDPTENTVWAPLQRSYNVNWWSPDESYGVGDIRRYQGDRRYYFCKVATASIVPGADAATWYLLPAWSPEFSLAADEALGLSEMGTPLLVATGDPRQSDEYAGWSKLKFKTSRAGVLLEGGDRDRGQAWFQFRLPVPSWDGDIYTEGSYDTDEQVYYTPEGDFFKSLVDDNLDTPTADTWERVEFPAFLGDFTALSVQADLLAGPDGQLEKYAVEDAAGFACLRREIDLVLRQQKQSTPMNVLTRP